MPDRQLRLLLVLAESAGGIGRHVATLARGFASRGAQVTVCGPQGSLDRLGDLGPARSRPAPVGAVTPGKVVVARRSLRQLAAEADIVHAHGLRAGAAAAAANAHPLVVTWHNALLLGGPRGALQAGLARYVARHSDLTLGASEDLAADAKQAGAGRVRATFVVAPGLASPSRDRTAVRAELGVGDRPVVLAVGRLQAQKRFDVLVDAATGWADQEAPVVVIAGDGPDRAALAAQITATRAPVHLLGSRADVADLLAAADVVAISSGWEAQALVAQEALRAGVPLVTTAVGGLPRLVGAAALQVPAGDAAALRAAIGQVLADTELCDRLVAAGHAQAATWPDEVASLDELMAAYIDLNPNLRPVD